MSTVLSISPEPSYSRTRTFHPLHPTETLVMTRGGIRGPDETLPTQCVLRPETNSSVDGTVCLHPFTSYHFVFKVCTSVSGPARTQYQRFLCWNLWYQDSQLYCFLVLRISILGISDFRDYSFQTYSVSVLSRSIIRSRRHDRGTLTRISWGLYFHIGHYMKKYIL